MLQMFLLLLLCMTYIGVGGMVTRLPTTIDGAVSLVTRPPALVGMAIIAIGLSEQ